MSPSAQCPVAKESVRVTSVAGTPREAWLTNPTVLTCHAPQRRRHASAPVDSGALGSGLL